MADFAAQALRIRLALLTAAAKLFFARPPECQGLLGSALAAAAADTNQDVHDRGLLYYRCVSTVGSGSTEEQSAETACTLVCRALTGCVVMPGSPSVLLPVPQCITCLAQAAAAQCRGGKACGCTRRGSSCSLCRGDES